MIRNILIPTDGSEHAQLALDLGADLAAKNDAKVVLLHIASHDTNTPAEIYDAAREVMEGQTDASTLLIPRSKVLEHIGNSVLENARRQAKDKGVNHIETVIDTGDAGKRILHHAKSRSADLIVMGSRGFGALKGLVLGSVSHKVFHLAPCSCVTVHHTEQSSSFEGIKSIMVPTDGSNYADKAVDLASDIAAKCGAKLTLVYVMGRGPSLEQLRNSIDMSQLSQSTRDELDPAKHLIADHVSAALIPPVVPQGAQKEIGEHVLLRAQRTAEAKGVLDTDTVLIDGDPARKIVQVAKRENAGLIAMGSRGLGQAEELLAGSVSYKVNHAAPCSCLIVR